MNIHCNAGVSTTNLVGDLPGYGTVLFYEEGIANILSLASVKRDHKESFNSEKRSFLRYQGQIRHAGHCFYAGRKWSILHQYQVFAYYKQCGPSYNNKRKVGMIYQKGMWNGRSSPWYSKDKGRLSTKDFLEIVEKGRYIRTVKEMARCILNDLPFKKLPVRITAEMIYNVIFCLDSFPSRNGILGILSPRKGIMGQDINYKAQCIW